MRFNQPIADVCWPDSLQKASFGAKKENDWRSFRLSITGFLWGSKKTRMA